MDPVKEITISCQNVGEQARYIAAETKPKKRVKPLAKHSGAAPETVGKLPDIPKADMPKASAAAKRISEAMSNLPARLHGKLEGDSVFTSGTSLVLALAMLTNGTEKPEVVGKLLRGLGLDDLSIEDVNKGCRLLVNKLVGKDEGSVVRVANAIFVSRDLGLKSAFQTALKSEFGAEVRACDFPKDAEAINQWAKDNTRDSDGKPMIEKVVGESDLPPSGTVITNAIAFEGKWQTAFDKDDTREDATFTKANGEKVTVPIMYRKGKIQRDAETGKPVDQRIDHMACPTFQAVRLPYKGDKRSMVLIEPAEGQDVASVMKALSASGALARVLSGFAASDGDIYVPRMELECSYKLKSVLKALGLPMDAAFEAIANKAQAVAEVIHKTYLKVDEDGTKAAAVTAIVTRSFSISMPKVLFNGTKPFVLAIVDNGTGTAEFVGSYGGPQAAQA